MKNVQKKQICFGPEFAPGWNKCDKLRWVEYPSNGLRLAGEAHDIIKLRHTGWFTDDSQEETVYGEVYQLPGRNGKPVYVPAVSDPFSNAAILDFHSTTDDLQDAASWADSMAESYAEYERQYQAIEQARLRVEEIQTEVKTLYADFRALARELRANCDKLTGMLELRKLIRSEYRDMRSNVRTLRSEAHKLTDQFGPFEETA